MWQRGGNGASDRASPRQSLTSVAIPRDTAAGFFLSALFKAPRGHKVSRAQGLAGTRCGCPAATTRGVCCSSRHVAPGRWRKKQTFDRGRSVCLPPSVFWIRSDDSNRFRRTESRSEIRTPVGGGSNLSGEPDPCESMLGSVGRLAYYAALPRYISLRLLTAPRVPIVGRWPNPASRGARPGLNSRASDRRCPYLSRSDCVALERSASTFATTGLARCTDAGALSTLARGGWPDDALGS